MACIILDPAKWRSQELLAAASFVLEGTCKQYLLRCCFVVTGKQYKTADSFSSSFCLLTTEIPLAMPIHQPPDRQVNYQGFAEY